MIARFLQKTLEERLFQGKLLLLTGPRQVGKTTLVRAIAQASGRPFLYLNAGAPYDLWLLPGSRQPTGW